MLVEILYGSPTSSRRHTAESPFKVQFPSTFSATSSPPRTTKKLSLSDYKAARMNRQHSGNSPRGLPAVLKPSLSTENLEKQQVQPQAGPSRG